MQQGTSGHLHTTTEQVKCLLPGKMSGLGSNLITRRSQVQILLLLLLLPLPLPPHSTNRPPSFSGIGDGPVAAAD